MGTYSRGTYETLPTDDADLTTTMSAGEISDLATINNVFVGQNLSAQIAAQQYKNTCSASLANLVWVGQSDLAPSVSPIILQAYNYSTAAWVGQATNAAAATNATCTLAASLGATQYLSPGGYTTGRVYQAASATKTFGYPDSILHDVNGATSRAYVCKATLSEAGNVTKISVYCRALLGQAYVKCIIHDDDGTGSQPDTLMGVSNEISVTALTPEWIDFTFASPVALTAGDWYLGVINGPSSAGDLTFYIDDEVIGGNTLYWDGDNYTTPIDWDFANDSVFNADRTMGIVATYTPA